MSIAIESLKLPPLLHLGHTMKRVAGGGARIVVKNIADLPARLRFFAADPMDMRDMTFRWWTRSLARPSKLVRDPAALWWDQLRVGTYLLCRLLGLDVPSVLEPEPSDRRFEDAAWQESPLFAALKQSYLLWCRRLLDAVNDIDGLDAKARNKLAFFTRQTLDALAPSNFLATNPEALRTTFETSGRNLLRGLEHLAQDLEASQGMLEVAMTDRSAFGLGENLALTPGKVVYQRELFQLIQYEPTSETVLRRPLMVVPSPMNKYYIMDLRPENSMIKWLVDQGHTVLLMSWVNPDGSLRHKSYSDYVIEGIVAAMGAVEQATGERVINATGYCYGGILLASALGYLAATGDTRIGSATLFTTMLDFDDVGDISAFIDRRSFPHIKRLIESKGYLDGAMVATTFRMLSSKELLWPYAVRSYLMGEAPTPFDMLYWNMDPTNMPATMHSDFLEKMYVENALRRPGGTRIAGVPIDLQDVIVPTYQVTAIKDQISPWKTCYESTRILSGPAELVLTTSGHLAGIVNPPRDQKYGFWTNDRQPETAQEWLESASFTEGSWWPHWHQWLSGLDGERVAARVPGSGGLHPIESAPGSYVRVRTPLSHPLTRGRL